jgi:hypothetical protein
MWGCKCSPLWVTLAPMKLAAYMIDKNLTPAEMAGLVGDVSSSGVRKWIYHERVPRPEQLRRIADVTQGAVTPNDFILRPAEVSQ